MFQICNWCGMMYKTEDCIENKSVFTGYFCEQCFRKYENAKLLKGE